MALPAQEEEKPVQAVHEAPHEATEHKEKDIAAEEVGPIETTAHKEEAQPVEAVAQNGKLSEAELAAPLDAITDKVLPEAAQPEDPIAHEEVEEGCTEKAQDEAHQAEPEEAQAIHQEPAAAGAAAAAEEPVEETKVHGATVTMQYHQHI